MIRCRAKTKAGSQCRNNAIPGTDFCYLKAHVEPGQSRSKRLLNLLVNQWPSLLGVVLAIVGLCFYLQDKKQSATSGSLSPFEGGPGLFVSVGRETYTLEPSTRGVFLADHKDPILSIHSVGGKLIVSTRIRNEKGDLIAELRDNEWSHQVRPAIFDRNYTNQALEIRDSLGEVALQIVDFGPTVHVAGIFRCKDGWTVVMGPILNGNTAFEVRPPHVPSRFKIPAICEYPSDKYLGVCPGVHELKPLVLSDGSVNSLFEPFDFCQHHPE